MSTVPEPAADLSAASLPEHLVLRCRCGGWFPLAQRDGTTYKSGVSDRREKAFTSFLTAHSLECATPDGRSLTVEPAASLLDGPS